MEGYDLGLKIKGWGKRLGCPKLGSRFGPFLVAFKFELGRLKENPLTKNPSSSKVI